LEGSAYYCKSNKRIIEHFFKDNDVKNITKGQYIRIQKSVKAEI